MRIRLKAFEEFGLIKPVINSLTDEGYVTPTEIQARAIAPALRGRDVLGCAQTGTGKTAAFAVPVLDRLGRRNRKAAPNRPFSLVLAPTRELAIQIGQSFATYGSRLKLRTTLVYGGVNQTKQVRALNRGSHIVVATPGRLLDLMNQEFIALDRLETFVLDEADRMLDMGFLPDLKRIISHLPEERQSLFFSATLAPEIVKLSQVLLNDPVTVNVAPESRSVEEIDQKVIFVERAAKKSLLNKILDEPDVVRAIVFTKTKRTADELTKQLTRSGTKAAAIHGNKSQAARQRALTAFRENKVRVLVATDVAARGIDIDGITHVVNFDLPREPEAYVHRIGRTGRAGAKGTAVSLCTAGERRELRAIERFIGHRVPSDGEESSTDSTQRPQQTASRNKRSRRPRANSRKVVARDESGSTSSRRTTNRKRRRRASNNRNKSSSEKR